MSKLGKYGAVVCNHYRSVVVFINIIFMPNWNRSGGRRHSGLSQYDKYEFEINDKQ